MNHHLRERRSFVETPAGFSRRLDDMIEELIAMRDAIDGDADLEDEPDDEAGLNELWPGQSQDVPASVRGLRAADDDEDGHDAEDDKSDSEATLGWSEGESLSGDLHAGSPFGEDEDGDEDTDIADMPHDDEGDAEPSAGGTWEA